MISKKTITSAVAAPNALKPNSSHHKRLERALMIAPPAQHPTQLAAELH